MIEVTITHDVIITQAPSDDFPRESSFLVKEGAIYDCIAIWDHKDGLVRLVDEEGDIFYVPKDAIRRN